MINIENNTAKQRLLIELTRMQQNLEVVFIRKIGIILNRQFRKAASLIQNNRMNDIYYIFDAERNNFIETMRIQYRKIAKLFYDRLNQDVQKMAVNYETKTVLEDFWAEMNNYIGVTALRKVQQIDGTTREMFRVIINKGLEAGKSHIEIAKDLRNTGTIQKTWRARRIARTETHSVTTHSLHTAAKNTRLMKEKEWLSARDSRTRAGKIFNHVRANGERVGMDALFQDTGEGLMYPGDYQRGTAGNIINCRCIQLFHTNYKVEEAA